MMPLPFNVSILCIKFASNSETHLATEGNVYR